MLKQPFRRSSALAHRPWWHRAACLAPCLVMLASPSDAQTASFNVISPERIDLTAHPGSALEESLTLQNPGKEPLEDIRLLPSFLVDPTTTRRVEVAGAPLGSCAAGANCSWTVQLPFPSHAGAYTGALTISANDVARRSVPVVIRARGPNVLPGVDGAFPRLPFVLFWTVTLIGCATSWLLDAWFAGGGRRRALARILIGRARTALLASLAQATAWRQRFGKPSLDGTILRWQLRLHDLERLDGESPEMDVAALEASVNELAREADAARILERAVAEVTRRLQDDPARLSPIVATLDAIDWRTEDYAAKVIEAVRHAGREQGSSIAGAAPVLPAARHIGRLTSRVAWMDRVYGVSGWIVVALIAFLTFFDRAWSFGTARDYINVFLWTLGLTQTGSQLLARGKSSFTRL